MPQTADPSPPQRVAIILNAGSGGAIRADQERLAEQVRARFVSHGVKPLFCACAEGHEIRRLAEEALGQGCSIIVGGGGDGTVSTVAAVLAGSPAALGVLPLGTLNHFAKDLGLPLDLDGAIAAIVEGSAAAVDLGEVNGRTFINNSSLGLYPRLVREREQHQRLGRSKWWAFWWGLLAVLGRYSFLTVRLAADGATAARITPFVFIGNNEYEIHGFNIGTRPRIDAGILSVYLTHRAGRLRLLALVLKGLVGRLRDAEDFETLSTDHLIIDTRRPSALVALDGELVRIETPLHYRCRRQGLRVMVPAEPKEVRDDAQR